MFEVIKENFQGLQIEQKEAFTRQLLTELSQQREIDLEKLRLAYATDPSGRQVFERLKASRSQVEREILLEILLNYARLDSYSKHQPHVSRTPGSYLIRNI